MSRTAERTLAQTCMSGRSKSVRMPQQRQANARQRRVRRNTKVTTVVVCHETAHERPPSSARPHLVGFRYRPRNCSTPHRLNGEHPAWRSAARSYGRDPEAAWRCLTGRWYRVRGLVPLHSEAGHYCPLLGAQDRSLAVTSGVSNLEWSAPILRPRTGSHRSTATQGSACPKPQ